MPIPNEAKPLVCTKCGAEVPEGKLVCDCFRVEADAETERIGIARFLAGQGFLYMTGTDHLMPVKHNAWTLCHKKHYLAPKDPTPIGRAEVHKPLSDRICKECLAKLLKVSAEALELEHQG